MSNRSSMHYEIEDHDEVFALVRIFDVDPDEPNQEIIERSPNAESDLANGMVVLQADKRGVFHLASVWRDGVEVIKPDGILKSEAQRIANSVVCDLRRYEPQLFGGE